MGGALSPAKPSKCPDCGFKLDPEADACPNCPWSYKEPEGENNPLKAESRIRDAALPMAFFALLGLGVWKIGMGLFKVAQDGAADTQHGSFETGGGAPVSKAAVEKNMNDSMASAKAILEGSAAGVGGTRDLQAELEGRGSEPHSGMTQHAGGGSVMVAAPDDAAGAADPGEGQGTISVVKESRASQAARPPREWRFRGKVYDLVTLKPIAGARLTLVDNDTNTRAETQSSSDGRYRTVLPPLPSRGYQVSIKKAGYAPTYAGPESAGVKDLDAGSRKELARQLGRTVEAPTTLEPGSEAPLVTDFFLAPLDVR